MPSADRGEVWLADLGYTAKVRPCLVLSVPPEPQDRVLVTLVPHTTSVQGTRFEVAVPKRFLKVGAFDAQGLITVVSARFIRKLGTALGLVPLSASSGPTTRQEFRPAATQPESRRRPRTGSTKQRFPAICHPRIGR